ncbi:MAG: flagellar hook-length control protein FliK [Myxococcaceae bacterium]|nr:flagellar hook-length control protein FliK [Myxococcaceae bacterium]
MKRAQSTQLSFLKRSPSKRPEGKQGRGSSPAFDEAFEAAQRAQVIPLRPPLLDGASLKGAAKEAHATQLKSPGGEASARKPDRRALEPEPHSRREANRQTEPGPTFMVPERIAAPTTQAVTVAGEATPASVARPVDPANALLELALHDASLTLDVQAQVVRVALETEAAGALNLEVRVHENRADLRVEGPASPLVVENAPALREVLSSQGLSLGEFSLGQGHDAPDRSQPEPFEPEGRPEAPRSSVTAPTPTRRHEGRIDVKV